MDASQTCSNLPAPFLIKTYEMIEDSLTDSIVSWSPNGLSFIVWNPPDFARDLLPLYFKHNNFSSFIRQLNTYGFRKIDPEQWEFANEEFIRGHKHLLKNIHRRKPIHSHSGQASLPFTDSERQEFVEEIDKLKHEKLVLGLELQKLLDDKEGLEVLVQTLGQRLNSIENRQRQMINQLTQQVPSSSTEKASNKKRRLLISSLLSFREDEEELSISPSNNACLSVDKLDKLESSLDFWENFLHDSNKERHLSSTTDSSDIHSSPPPMEFDVSSKDGEKSPALTFMHLSIDSEPKSSGIDVNVEPVGVISNEQRGDDVNPPPLLVAGENDVFWEQFLTETPGSETQEVQSARRDVNLTQKEGKQQQQVDNQHRPYWWNQHSNNNNVNNITEQMGHLTPTEKT
ncbi:heat stress transcription factor A-4c-like [Impatiens glandulifera]|uniref:heat stress transcription factor A-4c-like n=1 Tax=Impatiens glandulifera TaxID=253017 RepID=UPI001FB17ABF|nr:heat stress transcription factor A-4c-like [Impatiens glandulifera]